MTKTSRVLLGLLTLMMLAPFMGYLVGGDAVITWINQNEPFWLFCILYYEGFVGTATLGILIIEFIYDKELNENKKRKKKINRDKVKIEIDPDGNARITESPKDLDVSIDHIGKD